MGHIQAHSFEPSGIPRSEHAIHQLHKNEELSDER